MISVSVTFPLTPPKSLETEQKNPAFFSYFFSNPKRDQHLKFPYGITAELFIEWVPKEIYREEYGEFGCWYKGVNGSKAKPEPDWLESSTQTTHGGWVTENGPFPFCFMLRFFLTRDRLRGSESRDYKRKTWLLGMFKLASQPWPRSNTRVILNRKSEKKKNSCAATSFQPIYLAFKRCQIWAKSENSKFITVQYE